MGAKISKVIVARNIKVDKDYTNVTDADMLSVVNAAAVASANNYSFIRSNRNLKVNFNYSEILSCNYMAFQNTDYSNKWFFAWIDEIIYIDDNCVEIAFTVDVWSTWWSSVSKIPVFVERENVNDDRFGYHTLPEPIKPDKVITNFTDYRYYDDFKLVVFYVPDQIEVMISEGTYGINDKYFAIAQAVNYPVTDSGVTELITDFSAGGSFANTTIITAFMVPAEFITTQSKYLSFHTQTVSQEVNFPKPTNLNGYIPVNNKCFIYPYNYIAVTNGNVEKIYYCEKFGLAAEGAGRFKITGGVLPNGAGSVYPMGYSGVVYENVSESLNLPDFPMVANVSDSYAAWIAQKSSGTVVQGILSTLTGALAGGLYGGVVGAAGGAFTGLIGGVANYINQENSAKMQRDNVTGSNNVDLDFINGLFGLLFQQRCAMADDAERIDRFFSQFGYNISMVKLPNYQGRQYWNYVKVNGSVGYGSLPESARNTINNILNRGTTIWHSHSYLGNYFVGGNKMQNPII